MASYLIERDGNVVEAKVVGCPSEVVRRLLRQPSPSAVLAKKGKGLAFARHRNSVADQRGWGKREEGGFNLSDCSHRSKANSPTEKATFESIPSASTPLVLSVQPLGGFHLSRRNSTTAQKPPREHSLCAHFSLPTSNCPQKHTRKGSGELQLGAEEEAGVLTCTTLRWRFEALKAMASLRRATPRQRHTRGSPGWRWKACTYSLIASGRAPTDACMFPDSSMRGTLLGN
mmetsp:Transcript_17429/g.48576  ORF Transcript_17429/g.48576 Transcript_17429/m.48576 type:complete len:230 (+) Transcript_17429:106-795(+)